MMEKQQPTEKRSAGRPGDTSRTSSQGRKSASGGNMTKRGNPEMNEQTNSPQAGHKKQRGSSATNSPRKKGW